MALAKPPSPFGVKGGLAIIGLFLLIVTPAYFFFCYAQTTYFYFAGAFDALAADARDHDFFRLYHLSTLVNTPLAILAAILLFAGRKYARKACNIHLAISLVFNLLLLMYIPSDIEDTIPPWTMRPTHIAFGAYCLAAIIAMLYLNISKRGEHTFDKFHKFPLRKRPPSCLFAALAGLWSLLLMGLWVAALVAYLDRYHGLF